MPTNWCPDTEQIRPYELGAGTVDGEPPGIDEVQFTELFSAVHTSVQRYALRVVGPTEAEDLTADVFATIWARRRAVPKESGLQRVWVFRVAHNKILETIRARQHYRRLLLRLSPADRTRVEMNPEETIVSWNHIREILALLPPAEREAVALTTLAGLSTEEASLTLNCSVSAVTSRVNRARRKLRTLLQSREMVDETWGPEH